jgi:hypothetical protein
LPLRSGFPAGGVAWAGGIGAGRRQRRPLCDMIQGVWTQWVGGAHLLCVHGFIPAPPPPHPPCRPCRDDADHQRQKAAGERCAGQDGRVWHCARTRAARIPARPPQQASGDCPACHATILTRPTAGGTGPTNRKHGHQCTCMLDAEAPGQTGDSGRPHVLMCLDRQATAGLCLTA